MKLSSSWEGGVWQSDSSAVVLILCVWGTTAAAARFHSYRKGSSQDWHLADIRQAENPPFHPPLWLSYLNLGEYRDICFHFNDFFFPLTKVLSISTNANWSTVLKVWALPSPQIPKLFNSSLRIKLQIVFVTCIKLQPRAPRYFRLECNPGCSKHTMPKWPWITCISPFPTSSSLKLGSSLQQSLHSPCMKRSKRQTQTRLKLTSFLP